MHANTIQSLWLGGELSPIERMCLNSFVKNGHDVVLYTYDDVKNAPDGVRLADANPILPEAAIFLAQNSYACFSDYFRSKLLYDRGGIWVDMDIVCLKPFDFGDPVCMGYFEEDNINGAVLKLPPQHPVAGILLGRFREPWTAPNVGLAIPGELMQEMLRKYPGDPDALIGKVLENEGEDYLRKIYYSYSLWGTLGGPWALTDIVPGLSLQETVREINCFYPVHHDNWWAVFYDRGLEQKLDLSQSYSLHLWNNAFKRYKLFNKYEPFLEGSLMHGLYRKYGD